MGDAGIGNEGKCLRNSCKEKMLWMLFALFAIVMTLIRQNILASFLLAGLLFFLKAKTSKKIAFISFVVVLFYFVLSQFKIYNS